MKLKIAVCDDAAEQKDALCAAVSGWAADREYEVVLRAFDSAEAFLFHYETERDFDALLLDVEMGAMSGIELARRLRGEKCRAEILFITSHAEFIGEGYEVDALHYLMKPVAEEKLRAVLDRAAERLAVEPPYLVIAAEGETLKLYEREIVSVEAFLHYVLIRTDAREYRVKEKISELETRLSGRFFRCHRSYLVSLSRVQSISRSEVRLENGETVPLARGKYDEINRAYIRYYEKP